MPPSVRRRPAPKRVFARADHRMGVKSELTDYRPSRPGAVVFSQSHLRPLFGHSSGGRYSGLAVPRGSAEGSGTPRGRTAARLLAPDHEANANRPEIDRGPVLRTDD